MKIKKSKITAIAVLGCLFACTMCLAACGGTEKKTGTLTYELDGGTLPATFDVTATYEAGTTPEIPEPIKDFYTFQKWYTDSAHTVEWGGSVAEGTTTLWATYELNDYVVILKDGATQLGMVQAKEGDSVLSAIATFDAAEREGYTATWKNASGTAFTADDKVTATQSKQALAIPQILIRLRSMRAMAKWWTARRLNTALHTARCST